MHALLGAGIGIGIVVALVLLFIFHEEIEGCALWVLIGALVLALAAGVIVGVGLIIYAVRTDDGGLGVFGAVMACICGLMLYLVVFFLRVAG